MQKQLFIIILTASFIILIYIYMSNMNSYCESQSTSNGPLTRIIHQSWKNTIIPKAFKRYYPSWKRCFPQWEHKFWTDEDNRNLVKQHYPWFLKIYDSFPKEIYRADVSRYFYLYHHGGIYTDMDNECLAPFEHLLINHTFVFGTISAVNRKTPLPENYVQNSFMYSKPRQQFWLDVIKAIKYQLVYDRPDIVTGPEHLCNMIHKYRTNYPLTHGMKIYDSWYFNPISWGGYIKYLHCKPLGSMTNEEWIHCRHECIIYGSYVAQYHSHIWE